MLAATCQRQTLVTRPRTCVGSTSSPLLRLPRHLAARVPSRQLLARSSSEDDDVVAPVVTGSLFELTKDNYWEYLKSEDNKGVVVVVDCFTDWCGPCKMIYPQLVNLSQELEPTARIVKFNCNKYNKDLGVTLKIKVAPTFLVYRDGEKIGEMTGAKVEKLRNLIKEKLEAAPVAMASTEEAVAMASYSQQPE